MIKDAGAKNNGANIGEDGDGIIEDAGAKDDDGAEAEGDGTPPSNA